MNNTHDEILARLERAIGEWGAQVAAAHESAAEAAAVAGPGLGALIDALQGLTAALAAHRADAQSTEAHPDVAALLAEVRGELRELRAQWAEAMPVRGGPVPGNLAEALAHAERERDAALARAAAAEAEVESLRMDLSAMRAASMVSGVAEDRRYGPVSHVGEVETVDEEGRRRKLGDILVDAGVITEAQLAQALAHQSAPGPPRRLGAILVEQGYATEEGLAETLASQLGLPFERLSPGSTDPAALVHVGRRIALHHLCMPVRVADGKLVVAMTNPLDQNAIEALERAAGMPIAPAVATPTAIAAALVRRDTDRSLLEA